MAGRRPVGSRRRRGVAGRAWKSGTGCCAGSPNPLRRYRPTHDSQIGTIFRNLDNAEAQSPKTTQPDLPTRKKPAMCPPRYIRSAALPLPAKPEYETPRPLSLARPRSRGNRERHFYISHVSLYGLCRKVHRRHGGRDSDADTSDSTPTTSPYGRRAPSTFLPDDKAA